MRGPAGLAHILWCVIEGSSDLSDVFADLVVLPADICADARHPPLSYSRET